MIKISTTPTEGYKYTPISERGLELPFSVWVKPLNSKQIVSLEDKVVRRDGQEVTLSSGEFGFNVCKLSIISWENMEDSESTQVVPKKQSDGTLTDYSVGLLPVDIIMEIANVVVAVSKDPGKIQVFFGTAEELENNKGKAKA